MYKLLRIKKKFELISGSTLISIYLLIWDTIVSLIRNTCALKNLYITQIIFSSIPCFFILIITIAIIRGIICSSEILCEDRISIIFCCCSFFLCFGGFWIQEDTLKKITNCKCNCECYNNDCYCCLDCLECCGFLDCFEYICCCLCCDCCECYDCCGCCSCFYCCGNSCDCYC